MQVFSKLTDLTRVYPGAVVALGMFDGVHIGHQSIIRRAVQLAEQIHGYALVFTFSNHPLSVVAPDALPQQIGNSVLRQQRLQEEGVDALISVPFTQEFAAIRPERFLQMLQQYLAPRYVVTGPNYTFGAGGKGTQRQLLREGGRYGFRVEICPAVLRAGRPVSSTRIRRLLSAGKLSEANDFLGYPFTVMDRVIHGDRRGRTLGFPTANLAIPDDRVMLPNGVYAAEAVYEGMCYGALANIGSNPTFPGCSRRLEVNIQGFSKDIYDRMLEVRFLGKLRDEKRFAGAEQLIRQMRRDRKVAELWWEKSGSSY